jgi:transcriptional regulator with XRE-family HTH domain
MKTLRFQLRVGWRNEWEDKLTEFIRERIKEAREEKGLSQRELAKIIERSNAYISQVERGLMDAGVIDLVAVSFALDKPIKYFLPLDEKTEGELDWQEQQLIEQFRKIGDDALKAAAVKHVAELAKLDKKPKGKK